MTTDTLEANLRAALDAGDLDRITQAAEAYERATVPPKPQVTMLGAALYYASVGLRVFPLSPGSKIPRKGSNGCLDATTNEDVIRGWWEIDPDDNIGIATGYLVDVVDIDGALGQKSRAHHWDDIFGEIDEAAVAKVLTPRPGGMHIWVPATGAGNGAGMVPGVDYRGKGGYVVAPPSVTDIGTYRFLGTPNLTF